jgi:hypothetical protein
MVMFVSQPSRKPVRVSLWKSVALLEELCPLIEGADFARGLQTLGLHQLQSNRGRERRGAQDHGLTHILRPVALIEG